MRLSYSLLFVLGFASTLLFTPCYGKDSKKDLKNSAAPVFYPPAPDEPHIQFLTSFSSDVQLAELAGKRTFFRFIVGAAQIEHALTQPYGLAVTPEKLFICDSGASTVAIANLATRKMSFFNPIGEGALGFPVNIAVDSDGTRYIVDTGRDKVLVYKDDKYVGAIGKQGETKPGGVALYKDRIYVTDKLNHCVHVYAKADRHELFTFAKESSNQAALLFQPTNIAIDAQGHIRVSDTGGCVVNTYDSEGKYLATIGKSGLEPGTFARPKGVAVDREDRTYVVDAATQVIQLFDNQGRVLMDFGNPSTTGGGQTGLPAGIAVDYDNVKYFQSFAASNFAVEYLIFVANQDAPQKIAVFGFGHKK